MSTNLLSIGLTKDGDINFDGTEMKIVEGNAEIAQSIEISFGTQLKEWFLNELEGADKSLFLGKSTDDQARSEAIRVLSQEERVATIESVTVTTDRQSRKRKIAYVVTLKNNEQLEGEVDV